MTALKIVEGRVRRFLRATANIAFILLGFTLVFFAPSSRYASSEQSHGGLIGADVAHADAPASGDSAAASGDCAGIGVGDAGAGCGTGGCSGSGSGCAGSAGDASAGCGASDSGDGGCGCGGCY